MRGLKRLSRVLLWLGGSLLTIAVLVSALALLVALRPQWFVHEKSLRWSAEYFLKPMGINLDFASFDATFTQDDFFLRHIAIKSRDLQVTTETMNLKIPTLALALSVDLRPSRLAVTSIGPVELLQADLDMKAGPPEPPSEPFKLDKKWLKQLAEMQVAPIHIEFVRVNFTPFQQKTIEAKFDARLTRAAAGGLWHLDLAADGIKVPLDSLYADVPKVSALADFSVDAERGLVIRTLGPLNVQGEEIRITVIPPDPRAPPPPPEEESDHKWIEQFKSLELAASSIVVKKLSLIRPKEVPMSTRLELKMAQPKPRLMNLTVLLQGVKGLPLKRAQVALDVQLPPGDELLPLNSKLSGAADLDKLGQASLRGSLFLASLQDGSYDLDARYNYGPSRFQASSKGQLKDGSFAINLQGDAQALHPRLQTVGIERCAYKGQIDEKKAPFLSSSLDCRVALTRNPEPNEAGYEDLLPKTATLEIQGPITIPAWNDNPSFTAPLTVGLVPMRSDYYSLTSKNQINLMGRLFGGAEGFSGTVDLDTSLVLTRFQNLVTRFSRTQFAIPAPFATLDGTMRCDMKGRIKIQGALVHMPFSCGSELDSITQTVWINVKGLIETRADRKPLVQAQIGLDKITLELPKIAVNEPVPQLLPDKRIMEVKDATLQASSEGLPVELDLSIKTPSGRPLKLDTTLAPVPIPITIDLAIKGDQPLTSGSIAVEQYDVAFLKKKAFIDHVGMRFDTEMESPELDGLIVFKDPDFRIDLKLSGTLERPFYTLESKPPRTQSEIISIILFGSSADSMDVETQRSVEDTRAAMVDGAIGLMSMYYLAATPIETVGYNPHTGLFRARVRLGKTLSLTVGSDLGGVNQSIGLRKRLTENWTFETTAETDEETKSNKGIAMFRWGRRY